MPDFSSVRSIELSNAILGEIYDVLTGGGDENEVLKDSRHFFMWASTGIPVDASEWDFMAGVTHAPDQSETTFRSRQEMSASGEDPQDPGTDAGEEGGDEPAAPMGAGDAARFALRTAEAFAFMTDFVPDASGLIDLDERRTAMHLRQLGATLTGEYRRILDECEVAVSQPSPEAEQRMEELLKMLTVTSEIKDEATGEPVIDPLTGEPMVMTGPTQFVKAYNEHMQKYHAAWMEVSSLRAEALGSDDPASVARMQTQGPILQQKLHAARQIWETAGFRGQVEAWRAELERLTLQSMLSRWAELRTELETTEHQGLTYGTFHWAQVAPAGILRSSGWSNFSISHTSIERHREFSTERTEAGFKVAVPIPSTPAVLKLGGAGEQETEESLDTLDLSEFELTFELTEVPIYRPAIDMNFLLNDRWRLPEGAKPLSDGGNPPAGSMVAIPIMIVLVRNLKLKFKDLERENSSVRRAFDGGGGISIWPFGIGVGVKRSEDEVVQDYVLDKVEGSITVPGSQIVGWRCQVLPKSPNPNPQVTEWVGPGAVS